MPPIERYPVVHQTPAVIQSLRLAPDWTAQREAERKQRAASIQGIETEKNAVEMLKDLIVSQGWDFREQYETKSGKLIDFVIKAPYSGGHIFFGVECKRRTNDETHATELADYLEQAAAYSRDLDMPVFVGPVLSNSRGCQLYQGGSELKSLAAFNIFGGRFNVGAIVRNPPMNRISHSEWSIVLRGDMFWETETGFNPQRLHMVCSKGSKLERKPMKIWK